MPSDYWIDLADRVIHTRAWGSLTDRDLETARAALCGDAQVSAGLAQLLDCSETTLIRVAAETVRRFAETCRTVPLGRQAVVAAGGAALALARRYAVACGRRPEVRVFGDWDAAMEWLTCADASSAAQRRAG